MSTPKTERAMTGPDSDERAPNTGELQGLFWRMLEIRYFEDEIQRVFAAGLVRGSTHLCQGQEAVPVGVCSELRKGDTVTCTYRGHGVVLAMGAPLDRSFGEILGRAGGLCAGKGGSMHLTDLESGVLGSFGIVGAHLPITVGAAFAASYKATDAVSVAFFGDGSTNIGTFHEALNLASVWKLPAVFVCENNLYGEYSPIAWTTPVTRLADRAASYAMPGVTVDGNDVMAVKRATRDAVKRARSEDGPTMIEAQTYRQVGHSRSDPAKYRPAGELERWLERDPITLLSRELEARGVRGDELDALRRAAERTVADALERAKQWPAPVPESRLTHTYA